MSSSPLTAAPSTAQIVIEILELLDSRTDSEHGLTAIEISKNIGVSEKTVRGHLKHCMTCSRSDAGWSIWAARPCQGGKR